MPFYVEIAANCSGGYVVVNIYSPPSMTFSHKETLYTYPYTSHSGTIMMLTNLKLFSVFEEALKRSRGQNLVLTLKFTLNMDLVGLQGQFPAFKIIVVK